MKFKLSLLISIAPIFLLTSCAMIGLDIKVGLSHEATAQAYATHRATMGTVLLDARWGRYWKCGTYENAQLVSFGFDRMPLGATAKTGAPDVVVGTPSQMMAKPQFLAIALLVPPGEYALSNAKIKVAESVSKVAYFEAGRSRLLRDGKSLGGSFKVAAGETVYIGNFGLDCLQDPILWRYYTKAEHFQEYLAGYKEAYPFLDISSVQYRLFETTTLGLPYELK
ncbi:hypothetical protein D3C72_99350 [compost metagenome]